VGGYAEDDAVGYCVDGGFESVVMKGFNVAARVTDEVVVVLAVGVCGFEAGAAIPGVDACHEPAVVEEFECAVDGRDADRRAIVSQSSMDLLGARTAVLCGEARDDCSARAALARAALREGRAGMGDPVGGVIGRCGVVTHARHFI